MKNASDDSLTPVPDWSTALWSWGATWPTLTYTLATCHCSLAGATLVLVTSLHVRFVLHRFLATACLFQLLLAGARAIPLYVDPFESRQLLPQYLSRSLDVVPSPCLTCGFLFVQFVLSRLTRVKSHSCRRRRRHRARTLIALATFHPALAALVGALVGGRVIPRQFLLLLQALFVVTSLCLCFSFLYTGFRVAQFTSETRKVLRQMAAFSRARRRSDVRQRRISKPRLALLADDEETNEANFASSDSELPSRWRNSIVASDTDLFSDATNHTLVATPHTDASNDFCLAALSPTFAEGHHPTSPVRERNVIEVVKVTGILRHGDESTSDAVDSFRPKELQGSTKKTNNHFAGASPSVICTRAKLSRRLRRKRPSISDGDGDGKVDGVDKDEGKTTEWSRNIRRTTSSDNLQEAQKTSPSSSDNNDSTLQIVRPASLGDGVLASTPPVPSRHGRSGNQQNCDGYLADSERNSPQRDGDGNDDGQETCSRKVSSVEWQSSPRKLASLPLHEATLSLSRIRQGRVLHRMLQTTYVVTSLGFAAAILQLYAMFGFYGVLASDMTVAPWPWLLFQTLYGFVELVMSWSIVACVFVFVHRPARRRRTRPTAVADNSPRADSRSAC